MRLSLDIEVVASLAYPLNYKRIGVCGKNKLKLFKEESLVCISQSCIIVKVDILTVGIMYNFKYT